MKAKVLAELGLPKGVAAVTGQAIKVFKGIHPSGNVRSILTQLANDPQKFEEDKFWGKVATEVIRLRGSEPKYSPREENAPWDQWGTDIEPGAIEQMENSCKLPVSVRGALMPDAHQGYGLPIGGVLAVDNAVIPFAVGVDIACRMKMTIYDSSPIILAQEEKRFVKAIDDETRFGIAASFRTPRDHSVMDEDWSVTEITQRMKDRAWKQLGSSGSGNHFVEFGELTVPEDNELGVSAGKYLALLSHSGSRGAGANVANHFSKLAKSRHPELPKELQHLAWLGLDTYEGQQYWEAMQLMGKYAAANHDCIHRRITESIGGTILKQIENHHNFAWKETHNGQEVVVHRKGATPAGVGTLGIIPGTMADSAYVVVGKGNAASLHSSSHGAGRRMSRTEAKKQFTWEQAQKYIDSKGVKLLSAGLDEVPMAYKKIDQVMKDQEDLVDVVASFQPRLVKMASSGKAED